MIPADLNRLIEAELPAVVALRHDLHAHPQIAYEETYASEVVQRELKAAGVPLCAGLGGTGVVGWLSGPADGPKEAVALRADMDALPIQEQTGVPYASRNAGCMHACGHDGHTAILLGAVRVLAKLREQLPRPLKFIFQPAEEMRGGAVKMIADGVLDPHAGSPKVGSIFGLHGWPYTPLGTIVTKPGPFMASADRFDMIIHGKGGHGAGPQNTADPITAAAHVITALQTIVSRNIDPRVPAVVSVGSLHAGTIENVIPANVEMSGTIRALDEATARKLHERIAAIGEAIAAGLGCRAEVKLERGYPATVNDPRMYERVLAVVKQHAPEVQVRVAEHPEMGAEDFSYYAQKVPACYFFLGTRPAGAGAEYPGLHTPGYDFNDEGLRVGMRLFCLLALAGENG